MDTTSALPSAAALPWFSSTCKLSAALCPSEQCSAVLALPCRAHRRGQASGQSQAARLPAPCGACKQAASTAALPCRWAPTLKPKTSSARIPTRGAPQAAMALSKHLSKAYTMLRRCGGTISAAAHKARLTSLSSRLPAPGVQGTGAVRRQTGMQTGRSAAQTDPGRRACGCTRCCPGLHTCKDGVVAGGCRPADEQAHGQEQHRVHGHHAWLPAEGQPLRASRPDLNRACNGGGVHSTPFIHCWSWRRAVAACCPCQQTACSRAGRLPPLTRLEDDEGQRHASQDRSLAGQDAAVRG